MTAQNELITNIVAFLNANGFFAFRQENSGRFDAAAVEDQLVSLVSALAGNPHISLDQRRKAVKNALAKGWRKIPGGIKGVPDIIGWELATARWITVEVKIGSDQIRPEQEVFRTRLRRSGGYCFLVRDFETFTDNFWRNIHQQRQARSVAA
jgi:hypothetical protein